MTELFQFLDMLFTAKEPNFIREEHGMGKVPIYMWIASSINSKAVLERLDRTLFVLDDTHWFAYAWSLCHEIPKPARFTFLKKGKEEDENIQLIVDIARQKLKISNNDWNLAREWVYQDIEDNLLAYAQAFGLDKKQYKKLGLEYDKYDPKKERVVGLDSF